MHGFSFFLFPKFTFKGLNILLSMSKEGFLTQMNVFLIVEFETVRKNWG